MNNTREVAKECRLSHRAKLMQERVQSGLSIRGYCSQIGIAENTYFYWQRRVRAAACEVLTVQQETAVSDNVLVPSGWAVCKTVEPDADGKFITVEINGCRVYIEAGADMEMLAKICRMLKSLC